MATPLSIVVPLYNGIETLQEALESVKNQVYKDWVCYIGVNGHGQTGGTVYEKAEEIVRNLGDPRFKLHNLPDVKGAPDAVNALVAMCKTDWIAHIDADDKWDPYKLLYQVEIVKQYGDRVGVIGTWAQYFGDWNGQPQQPAGFIDPSVFHTMNPMIHSSILIKKELDHYTNEFFGIYDYDCWVKHSLAAVQFYNIPFRLTYHRLCSTISVFNSSGKQKPEDVRMRYFGHT
jgi:glycosyltransferase involved in cell wall biosynthesis